MSGQCVVKHPDRKSPPPGDVSAEGGDGVVMFLRVEFCLPECSLTQECTLNAAYTGRPGFNIQSISRNL